MRAASHRRNNNLIPNSCTLFIRQRSDKQLLQRLADLNRDQLEYSKKIKVHNAQIKQIERINNLLTQDSLIMSKIEQLRHNEQNT